MHVVNGSQNVTFSIVELFESLSPPPFPEERRRIGTPGKFRPDPGLANLNSPMLSPLGIRGGSAGGLAAMDEKKKGGIFGRKKKDGKDVAKDPKEKDNKADKTKKVQQFRLNLPTKGLVVAPKPSSHKHRKVQLYPLNLPTKKGRVDPKPFPPPKD